MSASTKALSDLSRFAEEECGEDSAVLKRLRERGDVAAVDAWIQNPHSRQCFFFAVDERPLLRALRPLCDADRVLDDKRGFLALSSFDSQRGCWPGYQRRCSEPKSAEHWGQAKLALAEIEFLTLCARPGDHVVYAGAAPGLHINFVQSLFLGVHFWLYDPAEFFAWTEPGGVSIINEPFTDDCAQMWAGHAALFISDVRTQPGASCVISDETIAMDNAAQDRWTRTMRPRAALLKFRLPYKPGESELLDGERRLPVLGGRTTSECRLLVRQEDMDKPPRKYSHKEHSDAMFAFHTRMRPALFEHSVKGVPGLDQCADCSALVHVVRRYLESPWNKSRASDDTAVAQMINTLLGSIGESRRGLFVF